MEQYGGTATFSRVVFENNTAVKVSLQHVGNVSTIIGSAYVNLQCNGWNRRVERSSIQDPSCSATPTSFRILQSSGFVYLSYHPHSPTYLPKQHRVAQSVVSAQLLGTSSWAIRLLQKILPVR